MLINLRARKILKYAILVLGYVKCVDVLSKYVQCVRSNYGLYYIDHSILYIVHVAHYTSANTTMWRILYNVYLLIVYEIVLNQNITPTIKYNGTII